MDVKPGYKQSEIGVIPNDWDVALLDQLAQVRSGLAKNANVRINDPVRVHYLRVANVQDGFLDLTDMSEIVLERSDLRRFLVLPGDVLMNEGGDRDKLGRGAIWSGVFSPCVHQNHVFVVRCSKQLHPRYLTAWTQASAARQYFVNAGSQTTNLASINKSALGRLPVLLPPTQAEQKAIAEALSNADGLIESLEQLIVKKRKLKHGVMQELLTGQKRFPGFTGDWETKRISEIASPSTERNVSGEPLPVLTCSKHLGFVDSLGYFKNQVFSRDTSGYKIIRRGEIGYPANHVEEGSIGLQNLYDAALVSPIYVVFRVSEGVHSYFLHRLLKLDSYRQQFQTSTSSSVDRRGSLRWPAFSQLLVTLPPLAEQQTIVAVLSDMDAEIAALETRLVKTRQVKQWMTQELLTGRIRLI